MLTGVRPLSGYNYVNLSVGNPEVNKFRIAYAECENQKKDYVTIQAANYLEKKTISYEDEDVWIFPVYKEIHVGGPVGSGGATEEQLVYYTMMNRVTFDKKNISTVEYKEFKKAHKN